MAEANLVVFPVPLPCNPPALTTGGALGSHVLGSELTLVATCDWAGVGIRPKSSQLELVLCSLGQFRTGTPERVTLWLPGPIT